MISRGAEECTFGVILKAIRAYFKAVFRTEQMCEHVISALKTFINPITIINSITDTSIVEMQKGSRHWKTVCVEGDSLFLSSRVEAVLL